MEYSFRPISESVEFTTAIRSVTAVASLVPVFVICGSMYMWLSSVSL